MLLLALLIVTMSFAIEEEKIIDNYVVKIKDNALTNVRPTETSSDALDLSGLGLRALEKDVFDNLVTLKNLRLTNNSLSSIPRRIFSKLGNLEHLCLANNNISDFRDAFVGLNHLKTLNISCNPTKKMKYSEFFGLPKSSVVLIEGLSLLTINSHVFEKPPQDCDKIDEYDAEPRDTLAELIAYKNKRTQKLAEKIPKNILKVCIEDGVLEMVDILKENEALPNGCRQLKCDHRTLSLDNLGISTFKKGWCRLDSKSIFRLSLVGNEIVEVTRDMLEDLPDLQDVYLSRNKIERLKKDIIDHRFITMNLTENRISEIEHGALIKTRLRELYLSNNLLKNTEFMKSLPTSIERVHLENNKISEISTGSFCTLDRLAMFHLENNLIRELKADSFHGLSYLTLIQLSNNQISSIQPGCFSVSQFLSSIVLYNNNITRFEEGTFDGVERAAFLDIGRNKISNIQDFFRNGLPRGLYTLKCDFNDIEELERGVFKNSPHNRLILDGNKISRIEQGAFDLPGLTMLSLDKNNLRELDRDSFQGLKDMKRLSLVGNGITTVPKSFAKHLGNLRDLDLGHNPIQKLENGTLYGLNKSEPTLVYLDQVPVEIVEGGLFDDL